MFWEKNNHLQIPVCNDHGSAMEMALLELKRPYERREGGAAV
jgi:hypothetical protein